MADDNPPIRQDLFYVPETQGKPEIQLLGVADDFSGIPAAGVSVDLLAHPAKLTDLQPPRQVDSTARITVAGLELMHMITKGQMPTVDGPSLSAAEQFDALAA